MAVIELDDYITVVQCARLCDSSEESIREWLRTGKLAGVIGPGGHRLILRESAMRYARARRRKLQAQSAAGR
jgi:predicted site-specific integrase-resolvase